MLRNYLHTSLRNLLKFKAYTAINVGGLAVALAAFILLLLYLNYELSYDRWDPSLQRTYRVTLRTGSNFNDDPTPAPLAPFLAQRVPGITGYSRIQAAGSWDVLIATQGLPQEKQLYIKNFVSADSAFFSVFPYKLIKGDPATIFASLGNLLLSEQTAAQLFGKENPIGKTVRLYNRVTATVTGVFATPSTPSHFTASAIFRDKWIEKSTDNWENFSYTTYLQTRPGMTEKELEDRINRVYYEERFKKDNVSYDAYLKAGHEPVLAAERVTDIHNFPKAGGGHFSTTLSLFILALLLLISGAINFSNLSLVKSFQRAKEVGVRKVLGSTPRQIRAQFLMEVGIQCVGALVLSLLLVRFALPAFNRSFGLSLHLSGAGPQLAWQLALALTLVAVVSGLYPAFVLSRFRPARVLKGDRATGPRARSFSQTLMVVQFAVSVFFICCVVVVALQMRFMKTRDLGLETSQVVRVAAEQKIWDAGFEGTRTRLLEIPGVEYVSKTTVVPGMESIDTATQQFLFNGKEFRMVSERVSEDIFATLSVPAVEGRTFSYDHPEDEDNTAVINETAARALGGSGAVGSYIRFKDCTETPYKIVGVVGDFHVSGFESRIQPALYSISNKHCGYMSGSNLLLRVRPQHIQATLTALGEAWKTIDPGVPIRYSFMDDDFAKLLSSYTRLESVITLFAGISIMISLIGLLALAAYISQRRTKEIGIRKVLGAGLLDLTGLLTRQFAFLVGIGILVAVPLAWWALNNWLDHFAYHVGLNLWMLLASGGVALLLSVVTVGLQALRAARANPVDSLRMD